MKNPYLTTMFTLCVLCHIVNAQIPNLQWDKRFAGPSGSDKGIAIVLDPSGNVYVTGKSFSSSTGIDFLTIKYNSYGDTIWTRRYNGITNGTDEPVSIKRDASGSIYVTGKTQISNLSFNMIIIKYDSLGVIKWTASYNGNINNGDDIVYDLTTDESRNVYVVGSSDLVAGGSSTIGVVIKYDSTGVRKWVTNYLNLINLVEINNQQNIIVAAYDDFLALYNLYEVNSENGSEIKEYQGGTITLNFGFPNAMILDNADNIYVSSTYSGINPRAYTAKFTHNNSNPTWWAWTSGNGLGIDIGLDASLNVYTLMSFNSTHNFFYLKKNSPVGETLWSTPYPTEGGIDYHPVSMSLKKNLNNPDIYVSGYNSTGNIVLQKYENETGDTLWTITYDCGNNGIDIPSMMVQDIDDNIYITGYSNCNGTSDDIKTLKYCLSAPPQPGPITGDINVCQGISETYTIAPVSGAINYSWSLPMGWTGSSTTNSITVTPSSSGAISVTANSQLCTSDPRVLSVVVNKPPNPPTIINGETQPCMGTLNSYNIASVPGATSYTWSQPGAPPVTNMDLSISFIATTSGNISVLANNECGSSPEILLNITVNPTPSTPEQIFGDTIVCNGDELNLSILPEAGVHYVWTIPLGWGIESDTGSTIVVYPEESGTVSVMGTLGNCSSGLQELSIISYGQPSSPSSINGQNDICTGNSYAYLINEVDDATSYSWTWPSGWIVNVTSDTSILVIADSSGILYVTANNICDTSLSQQLLIAAHSEVPFTPGPITGADSVCIGDTVQYTINTIQDASFYNWIRPSTDWTFVGDHSGNTVTLVVGTPSGKLRVKAGNGCGESGTSELAINEKCTVGTNDPKLAESTYVFPNPTNGNFTVTVDAIEIRKVEVFDITGKLVYQSDYKSSNSATFNLSHIFSGLYLIRVYLDNSIVTKLLIKI